MRHLICAFVLTTLSAASAQAQELASTLDQLRVLVKPGEVLTITDATGARLRARFAAISPTSLIVETSGQRREILPGDVDRITKKVDDSLVNGAVIGLAIGAGFGALAAYGANGPGVGWVVLGSLLYAGIGSGIGVGVDALVRGERVIFAAPPAASVVRVSPILAEQRKGIAVSLRLGR